MKLNRTFQPAKFTTAFAKVNPTRNGGINVNTHRFRAQDQFVSLYKMLIDARIGLCTHRIVNAEETDIPVSYIFIVDCGL